MKIFGKLITIIILITLLIAAWLLFSRATSFNGKLKHIYINPASTLSFQAQIEEQINKGDIIDNVKAFNFFAQYSGAFTALTPGRFTIKKGESIYSIIQMFKHNRQDTVHFTIKRVRTLKGFAAMLGNNFISDSAKSLAFISSNDSLRPFGVDTFTFTTLLLPGTYDMKWQYTMPQILSIFAKAKENFWQSNNRRERAAALGLTPEQATTLASIVEDETLKNSEKDTIAGVYLNRLQRGMPLAADPTIKFALNDFTIKRILFEDLKVKSPYNTYINKGLPPGAICTPDSATIEAVLNAPKTDYLFFVAKPDFSGYHNFSIDFKSHALKAKEYQDALDARNIQ
ncbi:endolytic transglycosylase MltG [Arachidicoccus soli]|uniref:Endolytic murein transglycosylase n=1 Tax=Arachidicoccus soli TaxID=2341117 RepID=A0A386HLM5_9BACT|nr:endolytic transglycosylase MltG [Arachidicoccus soli]AYD46274.1 endolytic transglycosylase MltG [Arachidicoccus soli]